MILPMPAMPLQVGPPTDYAKGMKPVLLAILVAQVAVVVFRFFFYLDIMGACIMGLQVLAGAYAWQQDMNITYLSVYGVICAINCIFSLVSAIVPMIISFATLQWMTTISSCILPFADFAGAYLAYTVYKDFEEEQKRNLNMMQNPQQAAQNADAQLHSAWHGGREKQQRSFVATRRRHSISPSSATHLCFLAVLALASGVLPHHAMHESQIPRVAPNQNFVWLHYARPIYCKAPLDVAPGVSQLSAENQ